MKINYKRSLLIAALATFGLSNAVKAQAPSYAWAKQSGGADNETGSSISTDAAGNSYVTGKFTGATMTLGTNTLTNATASGTMDIFVAKYDPSGTVLWARSAGGTKDDVGSYITSDAAGNSYVTGFFSSSTIVFGTFTLTNSGNAKDVFIVKYDPAGTVLWAKNGIGSTFNTDNDWGYSIAVDGTGNSYVTGYFSSFTISFGTNTLQCYGGNDMFIVKYDPTGNALWAKKGGGNTDDYGNSVSTDGNGNCYVTGHFRSLSATFGTSVFTQPNPTNEVFVVKYDGSGNLVWATRAGGSFDESGRCISTDAAGNSYVAGVIGGTLILGTNTLTSAGGQDYFLAKFDPSGAVVWAQRSGGSVNDWVNNICIDASGNTYLTGNFASSTLTIGSTTLTSAGMDDLFIAKYDATGNAVWAKSAGSNFWDYAYGISLDGSGNIYVGGSFLSSTLTLGSFSLPLSGTEDFFITKLGSGGPSGIESVNNSTYDVSLYPNPVSDQLFIQVAGLKNVTVEIYNATGQLIQIVSLEETNSVLNVEHLATGVYLVRMRNTEGVKNRKFIKQ